MFKRKLQVQPKRLTLTGVLSSIISQLTSTSWAFFATSVRETIGHTSGWEYGTWRGRGDLFEYSQWLLNSNCAYSIPRTLVGHFSKAQGGENKVYDGRNANGESTTLGRKKQL